LFESENSCSETFTTTNGGHEGGGYTQGRGGQGKERESPNNRWQPTKKQKPGGTNLNYFWERIKAQASSKKLETGQKLPKKGGNQEKKTKKKDPTFPASPRGPDWGNPRKWPTALRKIRKK